MRTVDLESALKGESVRTLDLLTWHNRAAKDWRARLGCRWINVDTLWLDCEARLHHRRGVENHRPDNPHLPESSSGAHSRAGLKAGSRPSHFGKIDHETVQAES